MKANELPEKYKTCDWLWNYGSIGLTKEHIKRLNNAINLLESLNEHTDAKYLKEIKDKLLEDTPEQNVEKINTDAFIEKAEKFLEDNLTEKECKFSWGDWTKVKSGDTPIASFMRAFRNYIKGE